MLEFSLFRGTVTGVLPQMDESHDLRLLELVTEG